MRMEQLAFTVFTATYNRAHTLGRVYESLRAQTFRDFEWLIIDDGSSDDTRRLVGGWCAQAEFSIRYIYQENQGKHVAHNRAVSEARGEFLLPLDSDDACVATALERLKYHWDAIPNEQRERFCGVTALCEDQRGSLVGSKFPLDVLDSDSLECHYKYRVQGEKWGFQRISVLRRFPMPGPDVGRSCIPEGLIWWKIAREYRTRYVNEVLRVYHIGDATLSHPRRASDAAVGSELQYRTELNDNIDFLRYAPSAFLRSAANFARFSLHLHRSPIAQWRALTHWTGRALWLMALPIGTAVFVFDRRA